MLPALPKMNSLKEIMSHLDHFVKTRSSGTYVLPPPLTTDNTAIQQDRNEIMCFVLLVMELQPHHTILDLGFGPWGGTHYLWRMVFDKVYTIEWHDTKIRDKTYETDERSVFFIGDCLDPSVICGVHESVPSADVLFLDANHTAETIKKEYELYAHLVRPGGIIAYHDSNQDYGVDVFIKELAAGKVDGKKHDIKYLHLSHVGIAFEYV